MSLQQLEAELLSARKQYSDAVEESGRQEARLLAVLDNAQSEQEMFTGEIKRRDETIQKLKSEFVLAKDTLRQQEETVRSWSHDLLPSNVSIKQ